MLGSTHQLFALLTALWLLTIYPTQAGIVVGSAAIIAVMVGALTPDLDQPTANIWRRLLGGRAIGNIFQWFSGGHRHMTHSLLGIILIGVLFKWGIHTLLVQEFRPQATIIWYAYMIGYISHPIADTLTDRGVPWLWPLKLNIKVPPGPEELRVTTGSVVETVIVRSGLLITMLVIITSHWETIRQFLWR